MGGGAKRELAVSGEKRDLDPQVSARLEVSLQKLDAHSDYFKQAREDEKLMQLSKAWTSHVQTIVGYCREACGAIIEANQIALDAGSDGAGLGARPWVEETSNTLQRLFFELEGEQIMLRCDGETLGTAELSDISYEWCEKVLVNWVIWAVNRLQ